MDRDFLAFVQAFERLWREGVPATTAAAPNRPATGPEPTRDAPVVLLLSPHPDDEALTGGLPLRLRQEAGWRIVNLPITLGSADGPRARRWRELQECCACLGFQTLEAVHQSVGRLEPAVQQRDPEYWTQCVVKVAAALLRWQPHVVLFPHQGDVQPAHVGTHDLAMAALRQVGHQLRPWTVRSEYWGTLPNPNLMVQITAEHLAHLAQATACHAGEVARNPYHLRLPGQGMDAVRRGAELVGGLGQTAPDMVFAMLYRVQRWNGEREESPWESGRVIGATERAASLLV